MKKIKKWYNTINSNSIKKIPGLDGAPTTKKYIPYLNFYDKPSSSGKEQIDTGEQHHIDIYDQNEYGELDWWGSYIVRITYDDSLTAAELLKETILFAGKVGVITIVFAAFTYSMNYLIKYTEEAASRDPLTGLPGRKFFMENINSLKTNSALFFIDLNNFKFINDTYGHETGDKVLIEVVTRLKNSLRKDDIVIRAGGDEFLVLIRDISNEEAEIIADKIKDTLNVLALINGYEIKIQASIGISIFPEHGTNREELLKKADAAMYRAKENKLYDNSNYFFYDDSF